MPPVENEREGPDAGARPRLRRDLCAITGDGVSFSLMVGLGETYVPAFALAVGLSEVTAGWIVALPLLAGAVLQLASPAMVRRLGSLRRWVVLMALVQAMSMLAYLAIALAGGASTPVLFAVAGIYWGAGLATGPAWNTWVGSIVPRRRRALFFARRSRLAQGAVLVGMVVAGLALQAGRRHDVLLFVFAAIFGAAALARVVSACLLASQSEGGAVLGEHRHVPLRAWLGRARHGADGRLLLYMLAVQVCVQVCGPFFTPYMLAELDFSYVQYLLVVGTSFMAKMIALPVLGSLVQRVGPRRVLRGAGLGLVPLSAFWMLADSPLEVVLVQCLAGTVWAAWELTTFLMLFDHIDESERTSVLTTYNLGNAVAVVCGALAGGAILDAMSQSRAGYLTLFGISGILRLATLVLLFRIAAVAVTRREIAIRPLAARPNGSVDAPILAGLGIGESDRSETENGRV